MKVMETENGRTILTSDGEPKLVRLAMRPARTAPNRIKATLVIEDDGAAAALPFAQAVVPVGDGRPNGYNPEFRLEMN